MNYCPRCLYKPTPSEARRSDYIDPKTEFGHLGSTRLVCPTPTPDEADSAPTDPPDSDEAR